MLYLMHRGMQRGHLLHVDVLHAAQHRGMRLASMGPMSHGRSRPASGQPAHGRCHVLLPSGGRHISLWMRLPCIYPCAVWLSPLANRHLWPFWQPHSNESRTHACMKASRKQPPATKPQANPCAGSVLHSCCQDFLVPSLSPLQHLHLQKKCRMLGLALASTGGQRRASRARLSRCRCAAPSMRVAVHGCCVPRELVCCWCAGALVSSCCSCMPPA